jgi:hypothetical protein
MLTKTNVTGWCAAGGLSELLEFAHGAWHQRLTFSISVYQITSEFHSCPLSFFRGKIESVSLRQTFVFGFRKQFPLFSKED